MRCAYLVHLDHPYPSQEDNERRREDVNLLRLKKRHDCGGVVLGFGWEIIPTKDLRAVRRGGICEISSQIRRFLGFVCQSNNFAQTIRATPPR